MRGAYGLLSVFLLLAACGTDDDDALGAGSNGSFDASLGDDPASTDDGGEDAALPDGALYGGPSAGGVGANVHLVDGGPIPGYAAPHPAFPRVVTSGGPVIAHPNLVMLSWDGYPYEAEVENLLQRLGTSAYWSAVVGQYGVGPATYTTRMSLGDPASAKKTYEVDAVLNDAPNDDIQNLLRATLSGASDPDAVYVLVLPPGSSVDADGTPSSAYHGDVQLPSVDAPYVVIPAPSLITGLNGPGGLAGIDAVTGSISHELIEAVTDPVYSNPAYVFPADLDLGWAISSGSAGELADMCVKDPEAFLPVAELAMDAGAAGPLLQRSWSNAVVEAGVDPCVPAPSGLTFFDALAELEDVIPLDPTSTKKTRGVDLGTTGKTVVLDLFSDRPTAPWDVQGYDIDGVAEETSYLTFTFGSAGAAAATGSNGTKLAMTITPTAAALAAPGLYAFWVISTQGAGADQVVHLAHAVAFVGAHD